MKQSKIWILAVLACVGIILVNACGGSDGGCETRDDCELGLVCNIYPGTDEGVCEKPVLCTKDSQCETGWECFIASTTGICIISGSNQTNCTSDADCDTTTEYCNLTSYTCEEKTETPTACQVASDCGTNEYCDFVSGYCKEVTTSPCSPTNPCTELNKNVCQSTNNGTSYICSCNTGYEDDGNGTCILSGSNDNPCDPNPCQTEANKSVCTVNGTSYVCSCNTGYEDDGNGNCVQSSTNPCSPNPCTETNKTVCTASGTGHVCSCDSGYQDDGSGNCVQQSASTTQAKVCDTIPASSFETPLNNFCVVIDQVTLQTAAEACGSCAAVTAGVPATLTMTNCAGSNLSDPQTMSQALLTTEHYIFVLAPNDENTGAELNILTIADLTQMTCEQATYDSVLANLKKKGAVLIDSIPTNLEFVE